MKHYGNRVEELKIAYIGGGSRGWAWGLMSDLAVAGDVSGEVALYDIDIDAAKANEIIGNKLKNLDKCKSVWEYKAYDLLDDALADADFVIFPLPYSSDGVHLNTPYLSYTVKLCDIYEKIRTGYAVTDS